MKAFGKAMCEAVTAAYAVGWELEKAEVREWDDGTVFLTYSGDREVVVARTDTGA